MRWGSVRSVGKYAGVILSLMAFVLAVGQRCEAGKLSEMRQRTVRVAKKMWHGVRVVAPVMADVCQVGSCVLWLFVKR